MSDTAGAAALTPPSELTLQAPDRFKQVEPTKAGGMVPHSAAALPRAGREGRRLRRLGRDAGRALAGVHPPRPTTSDDGQRRDPGLAETSNKLLASPVRAMQKNDDTGKVATTLWTCGATVEDPTPSRPPGSRSCSA